MKRIGLLSDTHGYLDERIMLYLSQCDEIWHAGDIGNIETANTLAGLKPFRAVHGNIDGHTIRIEYPKNLYFKCEETDVWITHIGGYPKKYPSTVLAQLKLKTPRLFICGHSHILRVMYDEQFKMLVVNPGAAGIQGFHQIRTMVRFTIDGEIIKNLEVIELGKRGVIQN